MLLCFRVITYRSFDVDERRKTNEIGHSLTAILFIFTSTLHVGNNNNLQLILNICLPTTTVQTRVIFVISTSINLINFQ